jgi:hypothetical protein
MVQQFGRADMNSRTASRNRIIKRAAAGLVAMAIAAPAAVAATSSGTGVVHTHLERSGTIAVSGYDGGAALAPSSSR